MTTHHFDKDKFDVPDDLIIDSLASANREVRKIRYLERQRAEIKQAKNEMLNEAKEWFAVEDKLLADQIANLELGLKLFHEKIRQMDPKRKTISLPAGDLKFQKTSRVEIDESIFIPFAEEHRPDLLRSNPQPAKVEIRQAIESTGEILPGAKLIVNKDHFLVSTKEDISDVDD